MLAWSIERRALLHIENRTRFPNIGEAAGSYNAKRAYLAGDIARRLGQRHGFDSVTHAIVALWSAEVLHVLRLRPETFRSVCPDPIDAFGEWWTGKPPDSGVVSTLVVLDSLPGDRSTRRRFVSMDSLASARPRYRGYADALKALEKAGRV